jgi:gluconokinase
MSHILALDIGTSSVRAAIYDGRGRRIEKSFVKNERNLDVTEDGGAEIDAEKALSQVVEAIEDVLAKTSELAEKIEFAAASCFWHSLVGVDAKGKAVTPVYGWADTRSAKFVEHLKEKFDENATHNRTGARFHSSYWTAKLLWLKHDKPKIFAKAKYWLSFSDFIALRFFGEAVTGISMASGTGIFDIRKCVWDAKLLSFLDITHENLPRLAEDKETFQLNGNFAERWQSLKNVKWFLAIGDGAANNLGANCTTKDRAALMIGTSGAMRVCFEDEPPASLPNGLWCYRIDRQRLLIGGALSDGGGLYGWLKENFKLNEDDDHIEQEIAAHAPDEHGLTFLPFLAGERSTGYHADARGAILGLRSATDAVDIVQAALESVAYRFAEIYDQLNEVCKIKEIVASGGALRESPVWTQIISDVLNQKMTLPDTREASSQGVINLALENIGKTANVKKEKQIAFKPNAKKHKIYQQARERHEKFYRVLVGEKGSI